MAVARVSDDLSCSSKTVCKVMGLLFVESDESDFDAPDT